MPVFLVLSVKASADQPPPPNAPDACHPIQPGDSIIEASIVSFDQPRYTCGPYQGTTQGWTQLLVQLDPQHAALQPTAKTGCILTDSHMVVLDDRALANLPDYNRTPAQIEVRVDGAPRRIPYANIWEVCGLTPGHHVVEMDTDRGPLTCEGDVRKRDILTLTTRSYGAVLRIEPTRLIGGASRPEKQLAVEFDTRNFGPNAYQARYDAFPPNAILRVWTSSDGVLRAQQCPYHVDTAAKPPSSSRPSARTPPPAQRGGCAHCSTQAASPPPMIFAALVVLAVILKRRG